MAAGGEAVFELGAQAQGEERAEDVAADRLVRAVVDRAGLEHRLHGAEDVLDHPQLLVGDGDVGSVEVEVGTQDPLAVEARLAGHLGGVDRDAAAGQLEVLAEAAVADQRAGALAQPVFQGGEDGGPVGGVLGRLVLVAADDVAAVLDADLLDLERRRARRSPGADLAVATGARQHLVADLPLGTHPCPEDVAPALGLEPGDRLLADHAAIGHQGHPADAEALRQPLGHRHEPRHVGGVARQELTAQRHALLVEDDADDHLPAVRPVVLAVAVLAEALSPFALEIDRRGVEEDQLERGEEVAAAGEEALLDEVLDRPRRLGRVDRLTEPGHRPVGVVELERLGLGDLVVGSPVDPGAIGAGPHQPVQHLEEHRPLDGELEATRAQQLLEHAAAAGLLPQPTEDQRRSDPLRAHRRGLAAAVLGKDRQPLDEPRPRLEQRLEASGLLKLLEPPEGGEDALARTSLLPAILDQLDVGVALGALDAEEHGRLPSIVTRCLPRFAHQSKLYLIEFWHQDRARSPLPARESPVLTGFSARGARGNC